MAHVLGALGVYEKSDKPPHLVPKISAKTKRPLPLPQPHQAVFIIITSVIYELNNIHNNNIYTYNYDKILVIYNI